MRHPILRALALLLAAIIAAYLGAVGYLYVAQRGYVFRPDGTLPPPVELGLTGVETVAITPEPGVTLTGWYAEPAPGLPVVLYFHGNAGNLSDRADRFAQIIGSGFGLMAMSYRGYPGSGGQPSEAALFADALKVFDWVQERTGDVVLHGESLGTGIATYVAAERPARALVLEAPYTAAVDMAAEAYPWVPVGWLMRDPFLSREHIQRVQEPVLIAHGTSDQVVPVEHGRRLFAVAAEPKRLAIIEGGGHGDLWARGLWATIMEFLVETGEPPPG